MNYDANHAPPFDRTQTLALRGCLRPGLASAAIFGAREDDQDPVCPVSDARAS